MAGQPLILTKHPKKIDELCKLLEQGVPQIAAAPAVGISVSSLAKWKARGTAAKELIDKGGKPKKADAPYLDFLHRVEAARSKAETRFTLYVTRAAADGDVRAAQWWLDRARPERWAQRQRHEVTGSDGDAIRIELVWGDTE